VRRRAFLRSCLALLAGLVVPRVVRSETYLSVGEAQGLLFPGETLRKLTVRLTAEQKKAVERASGQRVRKLDLELWRASGGGWFLVDEVLGKHEFITYAVGLDPAGSVRGIEVLEYRETYGFEIRRPEWRAQFRGKTAASPLKLDEDVQNISGATLSCAHVTDGVRRVLDTFDLVLRTQGDAP
jgi:hypothetical protein